MILLLLLTMISNPASDPDGLRQRVMRSVEQEGWSLHLRLDRDVLLSRVERRLLAEVRLKRPQPGGEAARLHLEILDPQGTRHQEGTLQVPCNADGTDCRLLWEVEAGRLKRAGYALRLTWLEGPRLTLRMPFRVQ